MVLKITQLCPNIKTNANCNENKSKKVKIIEIRL